MLLQATQDLLLLTETSCCQDLLGRPCLALDGRAATYQHGTHAVHLLRGVLHDAHSSLELGLHQGKQQ
jgi:hypothetical protein